MPIIFSNNLTQIGENMLGKILATGLASVLLLSGCSALGIGGDAEAEGETAAVEVKISGESLLADDSERPEEIVAEAYEGSVLASIQLGETSGVSAADKLLSASGNEFSVALVGSSTCPATITDVTYSSTSDTFSIMLYEYPEGTACAEDTAVQVYDTVVLDQFTVDGKKFNVCEGESCRELK
jgi:hypothetical protein